MPAPRFAPRAARGTGVLLAGLIAFAVVLSAVGTGAANRGPGAPTPLGPRSPAAHSFVAPHAGGVAPAAPVPSAFSENWYNISGNFPLGAPANRTFAASAFDPDLNGTLVFGGYDDAAGTAYSDTWLFANGTWANLTPSLSGGPSIRWAASMAWDPWNDEMVLFGGRNLVSTLHDTWTFNASGWTLLTPSTQPSHRQSQFSVFTWDPTLHADYLYGGSCYLCNSAGGGVEFNDSWTFVNGTWTNVTTLVTGGPSILDYGAWDPPAGNITAYASTSTNCTGTSSTWSFNGTTWTLRNATSPPGPVSQGGGFVYDGLDSTMMLFGGGYDTGGICAFYSLTWTYQNGTWTNRSSTYSPPLPRCCESFSYDPLQRVILLLGGAQTSQ
ncbi:MAG: hypothetical protein ACHQ16_05260, partial [Candidatus Lutacidiplasmatales archaeon]